MAGIHKIKAKQIDIASVETELKDSFLSKSSDDLIRLEESIDGKAPVDNPVFTGTVTLPPVNSETGKDNLKAATVGFVIEQLENILIGNLDGGEI